MILIQINNQNLVTHFLSKLIEVGSRICAHREDKDKGSGWGGLLVYTAELSCLWLNKPLPKL